MPCHSLSAFLLIAAVAVGATAMQQSSSANKHEHSDHRHLQKKFFGDHEQMMIFQGSPQEINVDPRSTYNEKFMALMNSPCRPEVDGFFGATSGDPVRVQYGFQLEIEPLSDVMNLLDVIEDKIVDSILSNAFPNMCGFRRRTKEVVGDDNGYDASRSLEHYKAHPSGFRFMKFDEVGK